MSHIVGGQPSGIGPVQGPATPDKKRGVPTKPTVGQEATTDNVAGDAKIKPQGHSATVPARHVAPNSSTETPPGAAAAAAAKKLPPERKFMYELEEFGDEIRELVRDNDATVGSLDEGISRVKEKHAALQDSIKKYGGEKYGGEKGKEQKFSDKNLQEMAFQASNLFPALLFRLDEKKTEVEQKNAAKAEKARQAAAPPLTAREENLKSLTREMGGLFHSALVTKNSSPEDLKRDLPKLLAAQQKLVKAEAEGELPSNLAGYKLEFADRIEKGDALLKEHDALPESIRQLTSDVRDLEARMEDAPAEELPGLKKDLAAMATRIQQSLGEVPPGNTANFLKGQMELFTAMAKPLR